MDSFEAHLTSAQYRARAELARLTAEKTPDKRLRRQLLEIADQYDRLIAADSDLARQTVLRRVALSNRDG